MAEYDPMGLAVPKMDDDTQWWTMMVTVTAMWHLPQLQPLAQFQVQVQMAADIKKAQQVKKLCQDMKFYSWMLTNLYMTGMHQTITRNLGFF